MPPCCRLGKTNTLYSSFHKEYLSIGLQFSVLFYFISCVCVGMTRIPAFQAMILESLKKQMNPRGVTRYEIRKYVKGKWLDRRAGVNKAYEKQCLASAMWSLQNQGVIHVKSKDRYVLGSDRAGAGGVILTGSARPREGAVGKRLNKNERQRASERARRAKALEKDFEQFGYLPEMTTKKKVVQWPAMKIELEQKLGGGIAGDAFNCTWKGLERVAKIIPLHPSHRNKKAFQEVAALNRLGDVAHQTPNLVKFEMAAVVTGMPQDVKNQLRENWRTNHMLVVILSRGGRPVASQPPDSLTAQQSIGIMKQFVMTMLIGETSLKLYHNDAHCRNVLLTDTDDEYLEYKPDGGAVKVKSYEKKLTIIDFGEATFDVPNPRKWPSHRFVSRLADFLIRRTTEDTRYYVERALSQCRDATGIDVHWPNGLLFADA